MVLPPKPTHPVGEPLLATFNPLALMTRNAEKHKDNPGFLEDAFATVDDPGCLTHCRIDSTRSG